MTSVARLSRLRSRTAPTRPHAEAQLLRARNRPLSAAAEALAAAYLDATDEEREGSHVMTSWHARESPDDVAFFFVFNTNFDDISFDRFLVLHLGEGPGIDGVDRAVQAQARALAG